MPELQPTTQPTMTTTSITPATIPITTATATSLPTLEITPAIDPVHVTNSMGGNGSTSHPVVSEPISETAGVSQPSSTVLATEQSSHSEGINLNPPSSASNPPNHHHPANKPPTTPPMSEITITFLLITGKRRTMSFPSTTTIGRVKELVWNTWPADWSEDRPPTPSSLRILYLGKMLQDEDVLESALHTLFPESKPGSSTPVIVHISIRPNAPSSVGAADDIKKKRRVGMGSIGRVGVNSSDEGEERETGCCGCVIC